LYFFLQSRYNFLPQSRLIVIHPLPRLKVITPALNLRNWLLHRFRPAPVSSEMHTHEWRSVLLSTVIRATLILSVLVILADVLSGHSLLEVALRLLGLTVSIFIVSWLQKRGHTVPAGILIIAVGMVVITGMTIHIGSIRSPVTAAFLLSVITAGMLFELRGIVAANGVSLLIIAGLSLAENAGLLSNYQQVSGPVLWAIYAGLSILVGSLTLYVYSLLGAVVRQARQDLHERQQAEGELRKLNLAVEQSPASISITDLNANIEYVNRRFCDLTGYTPPEVIGRNPRLLKSNLTSVETYTALWDTITAGGEWRGEFINRRKDGSIYYESSVISAVKDSDGRATHYLSVSEDITEKKQVHQQLVWQRDLSSDLSRVTSALAALQLTLDYLLMIADLDCGGAYLLDRDSGDYHMVAWANLSAEFIRTVSYVAAGSPRWKVIQGRKSIFTPFLNIRTENSPEVLREGLRGFAFVPLVVDGQVLACFNLASRRLDEIPADKQRVIVEIISQVSDTLARIRIQEELEARNADLRRSEARFRSLFEQTYDGVLMLSLQGEFMEVNQTALDILGYSQDEMLHLSAVDVSIQGAAVFNLFERLISGEPILPYETQMCKKNGQVIPVDVNVVLVRDPGGAPSHVQVTFRDIGRKKEAEAELRATNEELSQQFEEVIRLQEELREQALRDALTGLYNRRYLDETLTREISRAAREGSPLSIILTDIDHFKKINDTYGHLLGDLFLVEIASILNRNARGSDIVCRYGGEEFLLVLPGADSKAAAGRAEDIRRKCEKLVMLHDGERVQVTTSFGVASFPVHGLKPDEVIVKADKALYLSKNNGRNRVTIWENQQPPEPSL
jgi:diguanylate cyclase (GGDEF)-like protein/PAS domain S-box-containing protein